MHQGRAVCQEAIHRLGQIRHLQREPDLPADPLPRLNGIDRIGLRFIDDFDPALENRYGGAPPPPEEAQVPLGQKIGITVAYLLVALAVLAIVALVLGVIYYEATFGAPAI